MERIQNLRNQKQEKPKSEEKHPYGFPFKPYQVQLDLMDKIYDTLSQEKKIGLFESPTGTGKSLSLVCAILTWYLGKDKQVTCKKLDSKQDAKEDDWLSMFGAPVTNEVSNKPQVRNLNQKRVFKNLNSNDIREVQYNLKRKKDARLVNQSQQPNLNDEHLLNYDSDKEKTQQKLKQISQKAKSLGQSSNNHHQLNSLQQSAKEQQIIFCTRTHSQISQIINEIKRVEYSQEISVVPINHIYCMKSLKIQQALTYSMKNV